jgi:hypothetical protein
MQIQIIEAKTKTVITTVPVNVIGQNYAPSEREYFAEAWKAAVSDGLVDAANREAYEFRSIAD